MSELLMDIQSEDIGTKDALQAWNFCGTYKHWISELLVDIQTLKIRTFSGHTNSGYLNF